MKTILIAASTFIAGAILSGVICVFYLSKQSQETLSVVSVGQSSAIAVYGTLLEEKRYDDLKRVLESGLLTTLEFQKGLDLSGYPASQKFVRGYFDFTASPVPAAVESHISTVPTGKGASMKAIADFAVSNLDRSAEQGAAANP